MARSASGKLGAGAELWLPGWLVCLGFRSRVCLHMCDSAQGIILFINGLSRACVCHPCVASPVPMSWLGGCWHICRNGLHSPRQRTLSKVATIFTLLLQSSRNLVWPRVGSSGVHLTAGQPEEHHMGRRPCWLAFDTYVLTLSNMLLACCKCFAPSVSCCCFCAACLPHCHQTCH